MHGYLSARSQGTINKRSMQRPRAGQVALKSIIIIVIHEHNAAYAVLISGISYQPSAQGASIQCESPINLECAGLFYNHTV